MHAMGRASLVVGLSAAVHWLSPFPANAACGCNAMTLKHAGTTGIMCSDADLNFLATECKKYPGSSQGCRTTYAYDCNLGVNTQKYSNVKPYQKTGFQSVVTLKGGSTIGECKTGQILQETILSGSTVEPNPRINPTSVAGLQTIGGKQIYVDNSASNPFPQVGATSGGNPKYGGDNYADYKATDVLFSYDAATGSLKLVGQPGPEQRLPGGGRQVALQVRLLRTRRRLGIELRVRLRHRVDWKSNTNPRTTTYTYDGAASTNCTW